MITLHVTPLVERVGLAGLDPSTISPRGEGLRGRFLPVGGVDLPPVLFARNDRLLTDLTRLLRAGKIRIELLGVAISTAAALAEVVGCFAVGAPLPGRYCAASIYVNNQAGSDVSGDGSLERPFRSISRAWDYLGERGASNGIAWVRLMMTGTDYVVPPRLGGRGYRTYISSYPEFGDADVLSSETQYTVDSATASVTEGHSCTVNPSPGWTPDEHVGKLLLDKDSTFLNHPSEYGVIVANSADTVYWQHRHPDRTDLAVNGNTFEIVENGVVLALSSNTFFDGVQVWGCNITNDDYELWVDGYVGLFSGRVNIRHLRVVGGLCELKGVYVSNRGYNTGMFFSRGMIDVQRGALALESAVIDGTDALIGNDHLLVGPAGTLLCREGAVLSRLGHDCLTVMGGNVQPDWDALRADECRLLFYDCNYGVRFNKNSSSSLKTGGGRMAGVELHNWLDSTTDALGSTAYIVLASDGAHVDIPAASTLTGSDSDQKVSADGGTSNIAHGSDGTRISGGAPSLEDTRGTAVVPNGTSSVAVALTAAYDGNPVIATLNEPDAALHVLNCQWNGSGTLTINLSGNTAADRTVAYLVLGT